MPFPVDGFLLLLARLSGLFLSAPIFSSRQMPVRIKVFVLVLLSVTLSYVIPVGNAVSIDNAGMFLAAMVMEIVVGFTIGFVAYVVFAAIQLAGQLMDMQMGFGIVNVVDPLSGTQIPLMGNLTQTLALLMYLVIDGHHYLLQALIQSYQIVPVMGLNLGGSFFDLLMTIAAQMFVIAVKIAAPIIIAVLVADIAMGFVARTVPQMNVFIVGLPLRILVGLITLMLMMPVYLWVFSILFSRFFTYLDQIIMSIG
ncbi:MAG TPA: flagellar biosynthetic protein FliR [Syntrophomonadaceae bacterium]|mgnify:CR=1 FL=1|nr:flagellar type III secretion system protein FliR [Syntrophomonadaceae bacterium]HOQ08687.1 flagellar biosynthetic protein FliR [Syntrophomonadaceae bacterium]HPU48722.1 flagellar biosynthetic protein FliR [Syntrophomonadaceae bacterium]